MLRRLRYWRESARRSEALREEMELHLAEKAAELEAEAVLKATNVDGVYTADPKKDPKAKRYDRLSHQEAIEKDLRVMDGAAFALVRENRMPIIVLSLAERGAIEAVLRGKGRATVVG